jgi:hypothetical protein
MIGAGEPWVYPLDLRDALLAFGLAPRPSTPPAVVREALNDLYRLELRTLRDRLRGGRVPKASYYDAVVALRRRYWPLTLNLQAWERMCRSESA